jgi:hypothetical protein
VRSLGSFEAVPVYEESDYAYSPFFSPDGLWVDFSTDGGIKKVELRTGTVVEVGHGQVSYGAAWDETGGIVYTPALGQTGLWRVSEDGGEPTQLTTVRYSSLAGEVACAP